VHRIRDSLTKKLWVSKQVSTRKRWMIEFLVLGPVVVASFSSFILVGGQVARIDFVVPQSSPQAWQAFVTSFYAWSRSKTVGDQVTATSGSLYYLLQAILVMLLGTDFASKTLFILPLPLSGFFMLLLGHKRGWSVQAGLIAAIIYMVNPYVESRLLNGHCFLLLGYALLPLALNAYVGAAESPKLTSIIKAGLVTTFQFLLSSSPHTIVMTAGAMILYSCLQVVSSLSSRGSKVLIANIKSFVGTLLIFVGLDLFIVVPTISGFWFGSPLPAVGLDVPIEFLESESRNATILNVVRLTGWIGQIFTYSAVAKSLAPTPLPPVFDSPLFSWLWSLSTFYVPLLVLVALLMPAKGMFDVFTRWLSVVALFLAKGIQEPLGAIYHWLFTSFPLFMMFRSNSKFLVLLSFSLAVLAGQGANRICSLIRSKRRCASALLTTLLIIPVIFSNWPAFTGDFQGQVRPFSIPRDILETQEFLRQYPGDFRTVWLPLRLGNTEAAWFNWTDSPPMVDPAGNPNSFPKPIVGVNMGQFSHADNFIAFLYATLYGNRTSHVGQLLDLLNVRFVILRSDVLDTNGIIPREWETLYEILLSQEDLILRKQFGAIYVFENKWSSPHISISNSPALAFGDKDAMIFLSEIPGLRLSETPMFFVDDICPTTISQIGSMQPTLIWANKWVGLDDLAMCLTNERFFVQPSLFAKSSLDLRADWVRSTSSYVEAELEWKSFLDFPHKMLAGVPPRSLAVTRGKKPLTVRFHEDLEAEYAVWIRTFRGNDEGDLQAVLDGSVDFLIRQRANPEVGLVWCKLGTVQLAAGEHYLVLRNLGGLSVIDRIAIIPTYQYQATRDLARKFLSNPNMRNVILLRGIDAEPADQQSGIIAFQEGKPYLGEGALEVAGNQTIRYDFPIPQSGRYSIAIRSQSPERMRLSLYDKTFLTSRGPGMRWIKAGTAYLPAGTNHLAVEVTCRAIIDKVILYSDNEDQSRIGEIRVLRHDNSFSPSYYEVDPTSYKVSFASPSDCIVVFLERYDPSWLLYDENRSASTPAPVFGYANAYFVRAGSYNLKFRVQEYVSLGFQLSAAVALVLFVSSVVNTECWRRLFRAARSRAS